jgi:uncharacterized protein (DUF2062 family)
MLDVGRWMSVKSAARSAFRNQHLTSDIQHLVFHSIISPRRIPIVTASVRLAAFSLLMIDAT